MVAIDTWEVTPQGPPKEHRHTRPQFLAKNDCNNNVIIYMLLCSGLTNQNKGV